MGENKKKIEFLVVDTSAFLQNVPLQEYAENIYTCQEVIDEVTNKRQRHRLQVLPYDLKIKTVFSENVEAVSEFSRKTGDFASLSITDLKVMALTYQLEKEKVGSSHIRTEPVAQKSVNFENNKRNPSGILPGWYYPKSDDESEGDSEDDQDSGEDNDDDQESIAEDSEKSVEYTINCDSQSTENISKSESANTDDDCGKDNNDDQESKAEDSGKSAECSKNSADVDSMIENFKTINCDSKSTENLSKSESVDTDDLNDLDYLKTQFLDKELKNMFVPEKAKEGYEDIGKDGWITPSNYKRANQMMFEIAGETEDKEVRVACMTTDFAMQNVLKQMNLNVSCLNGRVIKQIRTFILRCYSCFKTTSIMTKKFCPKCGNPNLKRVAVSVDEEGKMVIHINAKKVISGRGKRFSLPTIKGGKHPNNPIIVEDQIIPQNRPTKTALKKTNPLDDDYIAGYSPFVMRDVTSRAAQLGARSGIRSKFSNRNYCKRK